MADQQLEEKSVLQDYYIMTSIDEPMTSIRRVVFQATHLEIKPVIIQMIPNMMQFNGLAYEDLNCYIANFLKNCDIFKYTRVTDNDAIRLWLFPFSLKEKVKMWLNFLA